MMDRAINKSTNKIISAFEIFKNGSYQNLTKGEWIAPKDSLYNWEEISEEDSFVHYVKEKEFINYNETHIWCSPHFAVYPNSKAKTTEESETHKLLKNWLFNRLKQDDLEIRYSKGIKPHKYDNKLKLSELDINWNDYEIEVTTKATKKLRADILLPFYKKDIFLGKGIMFEIQLSSQNEFQIYDRTIERALHGYSIVWLFENDFSMKKEYIELKNNILKVNSFSEQMHFAKKEFIGKLKQEVEQQCRYLDEKISETNLTIEKLDRKKVGIIENLELLREKIYHDIIDRLKTREAILINKIDILENNPYAGLIEGYKNRIDGMFNNLNNDIDRKISVMHYEFNEMLKKLNYPLTLGLCPQCNHGYMTKKKGKFGDFYGCSNYLNGCKHVVNIDDTN